MPIERKYRPIAEVFVQGDQSSIVFDGALQDLRVVGGRMTCVGAAEDVVAFGAKQFRKVNAKHLVQV